jgi:hypothetical protein
MKKCKVCREKFTPRNSLTPVCLKHECRVEFTLKLIEKNRAAKAKREAKEYKEWKRETKEKLMTLSDYIQICQKVFNTFIRMRDKAKLCISCDRPLNTKYDAGHFWSSGAYPNLRFHEDNVHGQCVHCNRDLHGNLLNYRTRLIDRIGEGRFDALEDLKRHTRKYSVAEVKELIVEYRKKIKDLQ